MRVYLNLKGLPSSNGNVIRQPCRDTRADHRVEGRIFALLNFLPPSAHDFTLTETNSIKTNQRIINIINGPRARIRSDKKLAPISTRYRPPSETLINETLRTNPIYVSLLRISPVNEVNSLYHSLVARKLNQKPSQQPARRFLSAIAQRILPLPLSISVSIYISRIAKYKRLLAAIRKKIERLVTMDKEYLARGRGRP